jgi:lipid II:glycine glycyltransferase (peptidoglycan interpeptide bridge formation enzyme)
LTLSPSEWDQRLVAAGGHLLQSWAWGDLKSRFGWRACRIAAGGGLVQLLLRQLPLGFTIAYVPKGPVISWSNPGQNQALLAAIHQAAWQQRAIFLKLEPDVGDDRPQPIVTAARTFLAEAGFRAAAPVQPGASQVINIEGTPADILQAMKQKTRYNIRLAERKGVTVRHGSQVDLATFYALAQVTSLRDGFAIHSQAYYRQAYDLFAPERCALLLAEYEGQALAALLVFRLGSRAYYLYGASSDRQRNLMPTYLLQWAAINWAKAQGCTRYDLWGIPEAEPQTLEAEFMRRNDGLWGVYRFKRGFAGQVVRSIGAFDYVYRPLLYRLYRRWLQL